MLTLTLPPYLDVISLFTMEKQAISMAICERIMEAIDKKMPKIHLLTIESEGQEKMEFDSAEKDYLTNLKVNLENLIEVEEYEMCAKVAEYIKSLEGSKS